MFKISTSKSSVCLLLAFYLLFCFGGTVMAACCSADAEFNPERRASYCGNKSCAPSEVLHQSAKASPSPTTCVDHCGIDKQVKQRRFSSKATRHVGDWRGIVPSHGFGFRTPPLTALLKFPVPQLNAPDPALVALRTVILLI
jgi:hypothetical protein